MGNQTTEVCHTITEDGPFLASDLVHCTDTKPDENEYAGEDWVGLTPPDGHDRYEFHKQADKTDECIAAEDALTAAADAAGVTMHESGCPLTSVACMEATTGEELDTQRKLVNQFFDGMQICRKFCYPGTETYLDSGKQDTDGTCINHDDMEQMRTIFNDMPNWGKSGTNGRFEEGFETMSKGICDAAKGAISASCCVAYDGDAAKCGVDECPDVDTAKA